MLKVGSCGSGSEKARKPSGDRKTRPVKVDLDTVLEVDWMKYDLGKEKKLKVY
jgi:hypothetical protein